MSSICVVTSVPAGVLVLASTPLKPSAVDPLADADLAEMFGTPGWVAVSAQPATSKTAAEREMQSSKRFMAEAPGREWIRVRQWAHDPEGAVAPLTKCQTTIAGRAAPP